MTLRQGIGDEKRPGRHWLTAERLRAYPQILLVVFGLATLGYVLASEGLQDPLGKPLGTYFSPFHAGARLALDGEAAAIYDPERLLAAQQTAIPGTDDVFLWPLPPVLLLLLLPFGLLPYVPGLIAWLAFGFAGYALSLSRALTDRTGVWAALAFPGAIVCALNSQTGLLAVALLVGALGQLERRPLSAGLLLGLAGFRPEFAVLGCLALAAGARWRALAATLATLAALLLICFAAFGAAPWRAYLDSFPWLAEVLAEGWLPWFKLVSVYGSARLLGLSTTPAVALQAIVAILTLAALVWAWRRPTAVELKGAVLACAALLVSPLTFYYDLVLLAPALLWLAEDGQRRGWRPWEREILAAAWALPLIASPLAQATALPLALLAVVVLLWSLLRRIHGGGRGRETPAAA